MRVFGYGASQIARLYGDGAKNKNIEKISANSVQGDTLQISPEAKALATFKAALKDITLTRDELAEDIKIQINKGTYKPDADKIAAGILCEMFKDEVIPE